MTAAANVTISPDWRESATHLPPAIESRPPRPVPAAAAAHPLPAAAPRPPAKGAAVPVPSKLHVVSASMLRAMCPHANDAGIIDVLRDIHTDSILLGAILCARLVSACDRIVQLTQLAPEELSANLLICVVLAEKLLNDAPFNDLVGMIAAALSCSPDALCQLEFRVLSILSVHEGTIVGGEQLVFFTKAAMQTNWARMHGAECISWLKTIGNRCRIGEANGWQTQPAAPQPAASRAPGSSLSGELLAVSRTLRASGSGLGGLTAARSPVGAARQLPARRPDLGCSSAPSASTPQAANAGGAARAGATPPTPTLGLGALSRPASKRTSGAAKPSPEFPPMERSWTSRIMRTLIGRPSLPVSGRTPGGALGGRRPTQPLPEASGGDAEDLGPPVPQSTSAPNFFEGEASFGRRMRGDDQS